MSLERQLYLHQQGRTSFDTGAYMMSTLSRQDILRNLLSASPRSILMEHEPENCPGRSEDYVWA